MKDRPIIFSGPMVRAILEGRKSQTRRAMRPQPQPNGIWSKSLGDFLCLIDEYPPSATIWNGAWLGADAGELNCCPYGVPGDRLWVRETWAGEVTDGIDYRADGHSYGEDEDGRSLVRWRPSIHMPRWASRLTLEIKSIRVERVQEISEEDARAEGVKASDATMMFQAIGEGKVRSVPGLQNTARGAYVVLWDSINAKRGYGWDANPWVWVIEFARVEPV